MKLSQISSSAFLLSVAILATSKSSEAQVATRPTWSVQCSTQAGAARYALIEVQATRTSVLSQAIALLPYLNVASLSGEVKSYFPELAMKGAIEDGRSHLVIHLTPDDSLLVPSDIEAVTLDLSYEFSESTLTLHDGSKFQLMCKYTDSL